MTGATGFVGRTLVADLLSSGAEVTVVTRDADKAAGIWTSPGLRVASADLRQPGARLDAALDDASVVIHCAGEVSDTASMHQTHVEGTRNLARAAVGRVEHWVQLSSVGVYGQEAKGTIAEDAPFNPIGPYEETKAQAELLAVAEANRGGYSVAVVRPTNIFGNDMTNKSLFALISEVDAGRFAFVGPEGAAANYVHVRNVSKVIRICASERAAGAFNVNDYRTMEAFIGTISSALGRRKPPRLRLPMNPTLALAGVIERIPHSPITRSRVRALSSEAAYSCQRAYDTLAYQPDITLEEGLVDLVSRWRTSRDV